MKIQSLVLRRPGLLGYVFVLLLAVVTAISTSMLVLYRSIWTAPIPISEADRVVQFGPLLSTADYSAILRDCKSLTDISAYLRRRVRVENSEVVLLSDGLLVTPNYVRLLRLPIHGANVDDVNRLDNIMMVSSRLWSEMFGNRPFTSGLSVRVEQQPFTIVGLLPDDYRGTALAFTPEFLIPIQEIDPAVAPTASLISKYPMGGWLTVIARLAATANIENAGAESKTITHRDPKRDLSPNSPAFLEPIAAAAVPFNLRAPIATTLRTLFALTVAIVLITVINAQVLAGFQLMSRAREFMLRQILGASPRQLLRRAIAEYGVLGLVGGGIGLVVSSAVMSQLAQIQITRFTSLSISFALETGLLAFGLVLGLCVAMVAPLLWMRLLPQQELSSVSAATGGLPVRSHSLALGVAILLQLSLSTTIAVPALFLVRSLDNLRAVPLGFERLNTVWARVPVGQTGPAKIAGRARLNEVLTQLRALPSVEAVGIASSVPLGWLRFVWDVAPAGSDKRTQLSGAAVDNEYFTALGLRFRRGSSFSDPNSIVVNTTAAAQLFGDSDPIGALVDIDQVGQRRIAGVVEDSRFFTVDERPEPQMYEPIDTDFPPTVAVIVKAKGQVDGVLSDVRLILSQGDRAMPSIELMTMQRHIDLYFGRARLMALASAILAGLGLLISVAGTIVIGSFVVRSRMHEAAVRLALGEQRLELFSRMAFHGLAWGTAGVATGVFLAQQVVNLSAQLMFGITATDRTTFAIPVMFVMLSLLVGVGSAALTAARMDPVDKLKVTV